MSQEKNGSENGAITAEATGPDDFDGAWKAMSDRFFRQMLQLCHPRAHADIDWDQGVESLDKDLKKLQPKSKASSRWADKLVKVWRKPGVEIGGRHGLLLADPLVVYLHVEFQHQRDDEVPLRIFTTIYRAFDRYQCPIANLVILGDKGSWDPGNHFGWTCWGTRVEIEFPVVKLWKYNEPERWAELETLAQENPFAVLVMAHLKSQATQNRASRRYRWKLRIFRRLLGSRYERHDVEALLDYVDWLMQLPEPFETRLDQEIEKMEAIKRVPYMTPWERRGIKKGIEKGREEGLRQGKAELLKSLLSQRFGALDEDAAARIDAAAVDTLDAWSRRVLKARHLADVFVEQDA